MSTKHIILPKYRETPMFQPKSLISRITAQEVPGKQVLGTVITWERGDDQ